MKESESVKSDPGVEMLLDTARKYAPELWAFVESFAVAGLKSVRGENSFDNVARFTQFVQLKQQEAERLMLKIFTELPALARLALGSQEWIKATSELKIPQTTQTTQKILDPAIAPLQKPAIDEMPSSPNRLLTEQDVIKQTLLRDTPAKYEDIDSETRETLVS